MLSMTGAKFPVASGPGSGRCSARTASPIHTSIESEIQVWQCAATPALRLDRLSSAVDRLGPAAVRRRLARHPAMAQLDTSAIRKTALHAQHVALGARMVPFARLGHAGRVLGHHRRAPGRAHACRAVRRQPHGRDRDRRQGRARRRAADHEQRRGEAQGRPGAILGPDDAERHVRRRPARLPAGRRALPARRQRRRTSPRTSRGFASTSPASATPSPSTAAPRTR